MCSYTWAAHPLNSIFRNKVWNQQNSSPGAGKTAHLDSGLYYQCAQPQFKHRLHCTEDSFIAVVSFSLSFYLSGF